MDYQAIGRHVLKRRKDLGLSQDELAKQVRISRNYISVIERGEARNISSQVITQIAEALQMSLMELILGPAEVDIPSELRKLALEEGLSFDAVNRIAHIPSEGLEPKSVEEWRNLYHAVRPYIIVDSK